MRIGEVAAAAGVSTRALRYYEQQGLITSVRTASGQRRYAPGAVERVRWIQALYAAGLSSKVLVDLLPCVHTGVTTPDMLDTLRAERARIEARARELLTTLDRLDIAIEVATGPRRDPASEASEAS